MVQAYKAFLYISLVCHLYGFVFVHKLQPGIETLQAPASKSLSPSMHSIEVFSSNSMLFSL